LFGDLDRFFTYDSYGVKYGFGSELNVKLTTNKKGTLKPYATIDITFSSEKIMIMLI